jgi:hypothetical protein
MSSGSVTTGPLWLAHCLGWGIYFAGLSAWITSCQPSHTAPPACLSTSVKEWPNTFEDLFEPARYVWCGLFCGWVPSPFPLIYSSILFWFDYRLFPSSRSGAPPEAYAALPYLVVGISSRYWLCCRGQYSNNLPGSISKCSQWKVGSNEQHWTTGEIINQQEILQQEKSQVIREDFNLGLAFLGVFVCSC